MATRITLLNRVLPTIARKQNLRRASITVAFFAGIFLLKVAAADGTALWTNAFSGSGASLDTPVAIVVDGTQNVLVTGTCFGAAANPDYGTIKYSGAGVALWTNFYDGGNGYDSASSLAVDGDGNVYVTGTSITSPNNSDCTTIKYSSSGLPLWTNFYKGPGNLFDKGNSIAVDGNGNVYVTGHSALAPGQTNYMTIKYSSAGVPLWTNLFGGSINNLRSYDKVSSLAVGTNGDVYVAGTSVHSGSGSDYSTVKYSTAGVALWTNFFGGSGNGNDSACALALDNSGNVFVSGTAIVNPSSLDFATVKYSPAGVALWTNLFNGSGNSIDHAVSLALDGSGNVCVTGDSMSAGPAFVDFVTIKYSSAGVPLWTNVFDRSPTDQPTSLAVDRQGNVYVTGYSYVLGYADYLTIKYSAAGVPLWTNAYNRFANRDAKATALAVDDIGNAYVTGYSRNSSGNDDWVTLKYSSDSEISPLFIHTSDGNFGFTNGHFGFNLSGPAGGMVVIQVSSNLQNWVGHQTNVFGSGLLYFSDPNSTSEAVRFYRAALLR